jgi:hypothetical protein
VAVWAARMLRADYPVLRALSRLRHLDERPRARKISEVRETGSPPQDLIIGVYVP